MLYNATVMRYDAIVQMVMQKRFRMRDRFPDADKFTFLILQQKHTASMWLQDAMRQRHILQAVLHI